MGATVRREPVVHKVPDYNNYSYLNINDFRGIDMSDNPFGVKSNTASDALNVYVDEQNILTTRPRLEKVFDSLKGFTEYLGVYPVTKGFLVHGKNNDKFVMWLLNSDYTSATEITGDIPKGNEKYNYKLSVFEQNDNIYLLDGNSYKFINDKYVCANVEGYIPTTSVGKNKRVVSYKTDGSETVEINADGSAFDRLNILSDKYKETYFWDGKLNPEALKNNDSDVIENKYPNQTRTNTDTFIPIRFMEDYKDTINNNTLSGAHYLALSESNQKELFDVYVDETGEVKYQSYGIPPEHVDMGTYGYLYGDCSSDGRVVVYCYYSHDVFKNADGGVHVYRKDTQKWYTLFDNDATKMCVFDPVPEYKIYPVRVSGNGDVIVTVTRDESFNEHVRLYVWEEGTGGNYSYKEYVHEVYNVNTSTEGINMSRDGNRIIMFYKTSEDGHFFVWFNNVLQSKLETPFGLLGTPVAGSPHIVYDLSDDGTMYTNFTSYGILINPNTIDNTTPQLIDYDTQWADRIMNANDLVISHDKSTLFLLNTTNGYPEGYINFNENYFMPLSIKSSGKPQATYADNFTLYFSEVLSKFNMESYNTPYKSNIVVNYYKLDSKEPLMTVTRMIDKKNQNYEEWQKRKTAFFDTFLTVRFNNERWFAANNVLFRTENNDPTYISNYNDLGETDESITGFNILQDDLLCVYKDNFIWTVSPTTTKDLANKTIVTYTYQESKNTVGNNAFGASIVSAYTEIPLQIAYDGVYGLKQIGNVQSPARISELLSESISKKWSEESREKIKTVKTLNRLYWTYFIFDYDEVTKIYLLDNRTMSWYYWELPITTLTEMVKDDVVIFINTDGVFYKLSTNDSINKYNPNMTEYYDSIKNKKEPIKWYWTSQILPLGTMNYSKRLVDTTFVLTDTDESDEYALNYTFKTYRKLANETGVDTISDKLNYIKSTTVRTKIPKFNFVQLKLFNINNDTNNNKFRLVGLGLKYALVGYAN